MKKIRLVLAILFLGSLAVSLITCAGPLGLNGIVVTPANPNIPVGGTQQFTATGYFNDTTIRDITMEVTWSSSNTSVATVNRNGLAIAISVGTTTITATSVAWSGSMKGGSIGSTILTVTPATLSSISVTPVNPSVPVGVTQQFTATGTYSDGTSHNITTQVAWSSSNALVTTINSSGLATALSIGTVTIAAASGSISGSTTFTVNSATLSSIAVTPANPGMPVDATQPFTAHGTYSDTTIFDITTRVTWSSDNASVATVDPSSGLATALSIGTATLSAASGSISGSTTLTVNSATLSSIAVTPANPFIPAGVTQQFTAIGTYTDGTTFVISAAKVAWSSLPPSVATIDSSGLAKGAAEGTATITATSGSILGSATLTVNPAILSSIAVTPANPSIPIRVLTAQGNQQVTQPFAATGTYSDGTSHDITTQVAWTSSNASVATVNSSGLALTATSKGTTIITATSGSISGSSTLTVF